MASETSEPYYRVRNFIEDLGGSMEWKPGGGPGGVWVLTLYGKTARIDARSHEVNELDRLYDTQLANPKVWEDYSHHATLVPDAFWKLVALFK